MHDNIVNIMMSNNNSSRNEDIPILEEPDLKAQ